MQFQVPVRACHLAEDGRALVSTLTQGFFLRYELDLLRPARDKASFEDASDDDSGDEVWAPQGTMCMSVYMPGPWASCLLNP